VIRDYPPDTKNNAVGEREAPAGLRWEPRASVRVLDGVTPATVVAVLAMNA
jgi:hypothetical protein